MDDFIQSFGQPLDSPDAGIVTWDPVTIAGYSVAVWVTPVAVQYAKDGKRCAWSVILLAPTGTTWNSATQEQLMATLLPSDATFVREKNTNDGPERIYMSADLYAELVHQ